MRLVVEDFLLLAHSHVRRFTSRGWRSNALLLLSLIFATSFVFWMMSYATTDAVTRVVHGDSGKTPAPNVVYEVRGFHP
jgi:cell division protein FtsB